MPSLGPMKIYCRGLSIPLQTKCIPNLPFLSRVYVHGCNFLVIPCDTPNHILAFESDELEDPLLMSSHFIT